jgi:hypothetical protein
MSRSRLLAQIDDELVQARNSMKFWRNEILLLSEPDCRAAASRRVKSREKEIRRLLAVQEHLMATATLPGATLKHPDPGQSAPRLA